MKKEKPKLVSIGHAHQTPSAIPNPVSQIKQMYVLGVLDRLSARQFIDYEVPITDEVRASYQFLVDHPGNRPSFEEFITVLVFLGIPIDDAEEIVPMWELGFDTLPENQLQPAREMLAAHRQWHGGP